ALLVLTARGDGRSETRVLIDTTRHVILSLEYRNEGKLTSALKFDDFVEVAGSWWARRVETTDAEDKRSSRTPLTAPELAADAFAQQMKDELAHRHPAPVPPPPPPRLA